LGVRTGQTVFPKNQSFVEVNLTPAESKPYNVVVSIAESNESKIVNPVDKCAYLNVSSSYSSPGVITWESFRVELIGCTTGNRVLASSDFVVSWILVSR